MGALPPVRRSRPAPASRARLLAAAARCALFIVVVACAPVRPAPTPAPEPATVSAPIPVPEKPVPVDPLAEPWILGTPHAPVTHLVEMTTAVRAGATAAALADARVDSVRTVVSVRWDSTGGAARRTGTVTSYRVGSLASGAAPAGLPLGLSLPIPVVATLDADRGAVRVTAPAEGSCGADAAAAQVVREALVAPPRRLARGVSWVDSVRTTVCRDSIPLALTSTRLYVVEDARAQEGRAVLMIRRRSTVTLRGTGTQFGEPVTIAGEGQGELLFGLRLDDGQMTDGNGVSTLTLSLSGRRKSQVVTQNARLEIRRR